MRNTLQAIPIILILSSIVCGCGRVYEVDPAFEPYVDNFVNLAHKYRGWTQLENLIMEFGDDRDDIGGRCFEGTFISTPRVVINYDHWKSLNEYDREVLVFHELGHCILQRGHNGRRGLNGLPISIMFPTALRGVDYVSNQSEYEFELFNGN